jgi:DNA-binding CsgD family transcriptional regulator
MFLLPVRIRQLFERKTKPDESRIFLRDQEMVMTVKEVANKQGRSEEEVATDFMKAGLDHFQKEAELTENWNFLSHRERQVIALVCLGHRNDEIAEILLIAPETVKTHLQNIFAKFNLRSSRELRLILKNWNFAKWWEQNQH